MNFKNLKVVFGGCARDCSAFLPKTLENIKHYSSLFKKSCSIIIENGSIDNTKNILKKNQNSNDIFLFCDYLNKFSYRGQRLESARNLIIETIKNDQNLKKFDLFIMLDLDDIGTYRIKDKDICNSIDFLFSNVSTAAVFANQIGTYYDLWTLRDEKNFKNDFWAEVFQYLIGNKNSFEQITKKHLDLAQKEVINKKIFSLDRKQNPISVSSAFGGFGIYKMEHAINNNHKYVGQQIVKVKTKDKKQYMVKYQKCEHVNFNEGLIKQKLKLYIMPNLINYEFEFLEFKPDSALKLLIK